jgi:hypothetical protein
MSTLSSRDRLVALAAAQAQADAAVRLLVKAWALAESALGTSHDAAQDLDAAYDAARRALEKLSLALKRCP